MSNAMPAEPISPQTHRCIGRCSGPVGLKGHLKATFRQADAAEFLPAITTLWLVNGETTQPLAITRWHHQHDDVWRLSVKGFTSRTQLEAAKIGKGELWASTADLPPLAEGEFWLDDVIGLAVVAQHASADTLPADTLPPADTTLGTIVRWNEANDQTFLEIKLTQSGAHALVPFTEGFFPSVNVAEKTVVASAAIADFLRGEDAEATEASEKKPAKKPAAKKPAAKGPQ